MDIPRLGQTNNNVPRLQQKKQGQSGYTTEHDDEIFALTDEEKDELLAMAAEREFYNAQQQRQPPSQEMLQRIAPRMKFGYGGEPTFSANIPYTPLRVSARPVGRTPAVSVRGRVEF